MKEKKSKKILGSGWVDKGSLNMYGEKKMFGPRLLYIYFQKTKPRVVKKGEELEMVRITISS